jgi:hypothetical protein
MNDYYYYYYYYYYSPPPPPLALQPAVGFGLSFDVRNNKFAWEALPVAYATASIALGIM